MAPDIRLIRHIDLHLLFSRAREEYFPASVALAESARRGVPRQAGNDVLGEQGKASRRRPRCRSTGLSPAQRWLPPHRSHRATLEDGAGCICSRPAAGTGTSSRWAPGSISSNSPQSPGFEPRCHGPGGPFSYEGRKKRTQHQRSGSRRAPRAFRLLRRSAFRSRPWWRPWEWTDQPASVSGRL
jgi:hypothetical protein